MADRYRTPGGWTVEVVRVAAGERLRIRHHGFHVADVVNVDDLARWIPAAELAQLERDTLVLASHLMPQNNAAKAHTAGRR
jgi:antitoxin (DNA-binding transcriptional repressor) of toxin-antitoxin stability system